MQSRPEHLHPHGNFRSQPWARWLLRMFGWRVEFEGMPAKQGVLIAYPHTSNWDFIVLVLAKWSVGLQLSFWAKHSLFHIPLFGRWLRWIGGIPVLRNAPRGVVGQAIDKLAQAKASDSYFWLGLSPEGTRKKTAAWRSGFYQTALQAKVPLALVKIDFGQRRVVATGFMELSGDTSADMARIARYFDGVQGCRPGNAAPIRLSEKSQ